MRVRDIQQILESWAPKEIAWERDNIGLQAGDPAAVVRGILVALDVTEEVIAEAVRRKANLLVSHHPLLFRPLSAVTMQSARGRCIRALMQSGINLYSAHTNLDFTRGGTSFALAQALGLTDVEFLRMPYEVQRKVVTFVPPAEAERVARAMADAGAGIIGNYDSCSFAGPGTGTFRGNERSRPAIGKRGVLEHASETRLEMMVPRWRLGDVIGAMHRAHPYEEVAYDVYPLENRSREHGMGIIGNARRPVTLRVFLNDLKRRLGVPALRCTGDMRRTVRRVAACGGSGTELMDEAARRGADVFVTADVRYHSFHDVEASMALVDAGHFETELPVVRAVVEHLRAACRARHATVPIHAARTSTNPIVYV